MGKTGMEEWGRGEEERERDNCHTCTLLALLRRGRGGHRERQTKRLWGEKGKELYTFKKKSLEILTQAMITARWPFFGRSDAAV